MGSSRHMYSLIAWRLGAIQVVLAVALLCGPVDAAGIIYGQMTFADLITNLTEGGLVGSYLAVANNTGLIAAPSQSRGKVFTMKYTTFWNQNQTLDPLDGGTESLPKQNPYVGSVAIYDNVAVVGSPNDPGPNNDTNQAGAVYIFHQPPGSTVWRQTQKLYAQRPVEGEQFGFSVAMNEFFIVIGVPYRSLSPARTETGAIEVYQRQYIYAKTDNFTHVHLATLFLTNPQTSDRLGTSVSISSYFIGAGGPSRFTDTESDAGMAAVWAFRKGASTFQWFQESTLMKENPLVNDAFGASVSISSNGYFVVGSSTKNTRAGAAYVYRRTTALTWTLYQTLQAPFSYGGDSFGAAVAIWDAWLIVAAPRYNNTGVIYGWRLNTSIAVWKPELTLRPVDPYTVGFGSSVALSDSFIYAGSPIMSVDGVKYGAAYSYNGYVFFPIKPPSYWVPADPKFARESRIIRDMDAFFVNDTFPVHVKARFDREVSMATYDGTDPVADLSTALRSRLTGAPAFGGGILMVPPVAGVYQLKGISYYPPENISSQFSTLHINISTPLLGHYWHIFQLLVPCGHSWYFCPGTFDNPFRYRVTDAWYSAPEEVPVDRRWFQQPCEQNRYCVAGIPYLCGRPYCWPMPVVVAAREAIVGETGSNGENYYAMRAPGLGVGDVIEFHFDEVGTEPVLNTTALVLNFTDFNCPIGKDGFNFTARWVNASLLYVTITKGSWAQPGVTDPALTRVGVLAFQIKPTGNLCRQNTTTLPSRMPAMQFITGTWGDFPAPAIVRAEAVPGPKADNASGPGVGDLLLLEFNVPLETRPVLTMDNILTLFEFQPPLVNVTFTATYLSWFVIQINFTAVTAPYYPNLFDYSMSVGTLQVRIRSEAELHSRDWSSPPSDPSFVNVTGSWGDIPEDLVLALFSSTQFGIYWTAPSTRIEPPKYYQCQVSLNENFGGGFPSTMEKIVRENETVEFNKFLVPFAYDLEYVWQVTSVAKGALYWVRCRAFLDAYYGPWCPSLPPNIIPDVPSILAIDRFTTDLPTQGGPVNILIRNMGFGRHIFSMPVNMTYGNANYSYVALNCQVSWNGSVVSCIAPPGVSRDLRWTMSLHGEAGLLSPPNVVLNYKPPRLYDIFSARNNTLTAPSGGQEEFNITGVNFGPGGIGALWWVRYTPRDHPGIAYDAFCDILVDHFVLKCITGPQAGHHLYWTVNVAGQVSEVPYTSTRDPNITSVTVLEMGEWLRLAVNGSAYGAAPIRFVSRTAASNASLGLSTSGGGIVLIRGTNFGPDSASMNLKVTMRPTRFLPPSNQYYTSIHSELSGPNHDGGPRSNYSHEFVCPSCAVTLPHFEITCVVPPGYGGQLEWKVEVLDSVSAPFRSNVSYAAPTIELLPLPTEEGDLYAANAFPFHPVNTWPITRQHQNTSLLSTFVYVPTTNDSHYVTNCDPYTAGGNVTILASIYPRIDVSKALQSHNRSYLFAAGYNGTVNYRGGDLFFMVDRGNDRFHPGPLCNLWLEQIVLVSTDTHWVALTGRHFVPGFNDSATVRAVIDGEQLGSAFVRVRDMELIEVLVPAFIGRRRLQVDVNGVRSNGMVLVNAKPVVSGFMEWRLGMEDVRGRSPRAEDTLIVPGNYTGTTWGGFGAWNSTHNCTKVVIVGHHFGSDADVVAGRVNVTLSGKPCVFLENVRHQRMTCCIANQTTTADVVVYAGGQVSTPVPFQPSSLVRKPIIKDFNPKLAITDGAPTLTVSGAHFLANGHVEFTAPEAEYLSPTGFERKAGGNYDDMPVRLSAPIPTPTPSLEPTVEDPYLNSNTPGCTWPVFWPNTTVAVLKGPVYVYTNTSVVSRLPVNHGSGHYFRIAVPSPIDRTVLYSDAYFLPFSTPMIQALDPAALPLSGGVLNIYGASFGNGGRVLIQQRLYYASTSVPGDPVYAGLHTVPHEVDTLANVQGEYTGNVGLTIGFHARTIISPAILEAESGGVVSSKASKATVAAESNAAQYSSRYTFSECMLLQWNHSFIRCVAPPGIDNLTTVIVDVGWGKGSLVGGLLYQPTIPCEYNTTFTGEFMARKVPSFRSQFVTGLWAGIVTGFGCLVVLTLFAVYFARIDVGDVLATLVSAITLAPKRPVSARFSTATMLKSPYASTATPKAREMTSPHGSFVGTEYGNGSAKLAENGGKSPPVHQHRSTDEFSASRSKAVSGSTVPVGGSASHTKKRIAADEGPRQKRASDASFREMAEAVEREALEQLAARERQELEEYRIKHSLDEYGNPLPAKGEWWRCLCCKRHRKSSQVVSTPSLQQPIGESAPVSAGVGVTHSLLEDVSQPPPESLILAETSEFVEGMGPVQENTSTLQRPTVRFRSMSRTSDPTLPQLSGRGSGDTGRSTPLITATTAKAKSHPLTLPGSVDSDGESMQRSVFGSHSGSLPVRPALLNALPPGSESGSDGEC